MQAQLQSDTAWTTWIADIGGTLRARLQQGTVAAVEDTSASTDQPSAAK
jgi:hypothetical protein